MSSHHPLSHPHSFVLRAVPTADSIRRCIRNDALSYVRQTILREGGQQISATSGDSGSSRSGRAHDRGKCLQTKRTCRDHSVSETGGARTHTRLQLCSSPLGLCCQSTAHRALFRTWGGLASPSCLLPVQGSAPPSVSGSESSLQCLLRGQPTGRCSALASLSAAVLPQRALSVFPFLSLPARCLCSGGCIAALAVSGVRVEGRLCGAMGDAPHPRDSQGERWKREDASQAGGSKGRQGREREREGERREERRGQEREGAAGGRHPKRGCASSRSGRSCSLQACYSAREHTPFAHSHSAGPCWEEGGTARGADVQGGEVLNMHRCVDRSSSVSGACTSIGEAVTASAAAVVFTWSGDNTTEQRGRAAGEHHAKQYDP